jgi:predicted nucleic acid-binding protein
LILVDTTVWIDFFAGSNLRHVSLFQSLIEDSEDICICGLVMTEILQGIKDGVQYSKTKKYLSNLIYIPMSTDTFVLAADIYRSIRKKGITIRNSIDCLIAAVCIEHNVSLLQNDKDFQKIKKYSDLQLAG